MPFAAMLEPFTAADRTHVDQRPDHFLLLLWVRQRAGSLIGCPGELMLAIT